MEEWKYASYLLFAIDNSSFKAEDSLYAKLHFFLVEKLKVILDKFLKLKWFHNLNK